MPDPNTAPGPVRALIVTNIPAPYRMPVYDLLDDGRDVSLRVLYLAARESNRQWDLPASRVRSVTLPSAALRWRGRYIHFTRGVLRAIRGARPDVIVTTGFNPPQLLAIAYCVATGTPHVVQTDGTQRSEAILTPVHRLLRRATTARSSSFVTASRSGRDLVRSWGAPLDRLHRSPLAVDNARFTSREGAARDVDLLFSGQLSEVKNPGFAIEVARAAARRTGRRLTLAFIGSGPLLESLRHQAALASEEVDVVFAGFQRQGDLPEWYRRSRLLLFPTSWDPWGLVANEASAAGTPVVISPDAGAAGELVRHGDGGLVLPLDVALWADQVAALLDDPARWSSMSAAARSAVQRYDFAAAAAGLRAALLQAASRTPSEPA